MDKDKEYEEIPCNNCQGCGCTTCNGYGFIPQVKAKNLTNE